MARHHCAEKIQLESQVRMSGGDHLVIDKFFRGADVAVKTGVAANCNIPQIDHAELGLLLGRLILPAFDCMRTQPACSGAVTAFATDTVVQIKSLGTLLGGNRQGVACQTFFVLLRRGLQIQDAPDAERYIVRQHLISASVFILCGPDAVFIL